MSVSIGLGRPADAAALAARCGDDIVRLRPSWPQLIASTRFARHARWRFGNPAATLECIEPRPKRWLDQRRNGDPIQAHFDLERWSSAYVRSTGPSREIHVFAQDGSAVATVRLDDVDASFDELIWLLADDDLQRVAPARSRVAHVPRPFSGGALFKALMSAFDAELALRFVLENEGGSVVWTPRAPVVLECDGCLEMRSPLGRVSICERHAGIWLVRDDVIIAYNSANRRWLQIALGNPAPLKQMMWRAICTTLTQ
jgi:hypothetical protein